jgi:hypothetical protein
VILKNSVCVCSAPNSRPRRSSATFSTGEHWRTSDNASSVVALLSMVDTVLSHRVVREIERRTNGDIPTVSQSIILMQ